MLIKSTGMPSGPPKQSPDPFECPGDRELQLDDAALNPGLNRTGDGFEGHFGAGHTDHLGKTGRTPAPVAAHLGLAAVGIEKPPFKIVSFRRLDKYHSVGPHRQSPPAQKTGQPNHRRVGKLSGPVVEEDKIVPRTAHFYDFQVGRNIHISL